MKKLVNNLIFIKTGNETLCIFRKSFSIKKLILTLIWKKYKILAKQI